MVCGKRMGKKALRRWAMAAALALAGCGGGWLPQAQAAQPAQQTLLVRRVEFGAQPLVEESELRAFTKGMVGKTPNFGDLQRKADEITRYLRSKGYFVAFAYLPAQDFARGKVQIAIEPGRYDEILIDNQTKIHDKAIRRELGKVRSGELVRKDTLERAVWLIGDMAQAEAKTTLKAGREPGTTTLILHVRPKGETTWGYVGFDNGGYRHTGRYEYSALINRANARKEGDLLTASVLTTFKGQDGGSLSYTTPVWNQGSRIGVSYARTTYSLGGPFEAMGATGDADTLSFSYEKNYLRTRSANWWGEARFELKKLRDKIDALHDDSRKRSHNWVLGLRGDTRDNWQGGGVNNYALRYTRGELKLKDDVSKILDIDPDYGRHTEGVFGKLNFDFSRLQQVRERVALWASYRRQWSDKNLDSSEKLSLGGPYGVRAYPVGEASGDQGWLGALELRYNLPDKEGAKNTWQLIAFLDGGSVQMNRRPTASTGENHRSLYGAGVGVNWSQEDNWAGRLHYAWKLGSEDAVSDRDHSGRLWFQLYRFF